MSRFNDFDSYILSLNPVLYLPLVLGTLNRRDSVGGSAVMSNGTGCWIKTKKGWGYLPIDDGRLVVADTAALRVNPGTIVVASPSFAFSYTDNYPRILSKRDVGGQHFELFYHDDYVGFSTSGGTKAIYVDPRGKTTLAVTFEDNTAPEFFYDGVSVGVTTSQAMVNDDADIIIGNYYTGTSNHTFAPLELVLLFNSKLPDDQIANLHTLWERVRVPTNTSKISLPGNYPPISGTKKLHLDGITRGMKALDISGNGIDFDFNSSKFLESETPSGKDGFKGFGGVSGSAALYKNDSSLDNLSAKTISFWVRNDGNGEAGGGRIFDKQSQVGIYVENNRNMTYFEGWTGGNASWRVLSALPLGLWVHVLISSDGIAGNVPDIYLNGKAASVVTVSASSGTLVNDAGAMYILDRSANDREFDGVVDDFEYISGTTTATEARNIYLRAAKRTKRLAHATEYPVSFTNVTSGFVGPWERGSGTWLWNDDQELKCIAAGYTGVRSIKAYGAWYFEVTKDGDGNNTKTMFISNEFGAADSLTNNGYSLRLDSSERIALYRITNGNVVASIFITAADYIALGVSYKLLITRNTNNLFSVYIKGGAYTNWTLAGSGTDSTHTTCTHFICDYDANDTLSKVVFLPYGMTLDPTTDDLAFLEAV